MKEKSNIDVLISLSCDLAFHCEAKRILHIPRVLAFLESALEADSKFNDPRILANTFDALRRMLTYERNRSLPDHCSIKRIHKTIQHVRRILDEHSDYPLLQNIIAFLGETGKEDAVTILFDLAEQQPDEMHDNVKNQIARVLFSSRYALHHHKKLINDRKLSMISHPDATRKRRGLELAHMQRQIQVHQ